ncbi:MAG: metallophosphoesterase [Deltaproteobacteria bacterium]|nr:metallophosphoesterase [Deltaproteobacteria bacterium]
MKARRSNLPWMASAALAGCALAAACQSIEAAPIDDDLDAGSEASTGDANTTDATSTDAAGDARFDGTNGDGAADAEGGADAAPDGDGGADADAAPPMRFAIIGDFGNDSARELAVANLVSSWSPEFVVTTGDNDYSAPVHDYDLTVGKYYHPFIAPYAGAYGAGAAANAFFPAIGNHDWDFDDGAAYFDFLGLPGNERYYEIDKGLVHLVVLDSDTREPDGVSAVSTQGAWAQAALAASAAPFKLVVFHHPAYTSGGASAWMDWPFKAWGASAVFTGHVHNYERLRSADGLTYFVVGQGGAGTSGFGATHPSSQLRYNAKDGAQLVEVTGTSAHFRYFNVDGTLVDELRLDTAGNPLP